MKDHCISPETVCLELIPEAVVVVGDDGRIASVNAKAREMFLYSNTELIGAEVEVLIPERYAHGHKSVRQTRSARHLHPAMGAVPGISALRKDGTEFLIEAHLSRDSDSGKTLVFIRETRDPGNP